MSTLRTIAIIGLGPRGGYALECLVSELARQGALYNIRILLFEQSGKWGNGPVYDLDQAESNWINIHERILTLPQREGVESGGITIPTFPSYHDWAGIDLERWDKEQPDSFPPRAKIGRYFRARFDSLVRPLMETGLVHSYEEEAIELVRTEKGMVMSTPRSEYANIDEVLLTIGHQSTQDSDQIQDWQKHVASDPKARLVKSPYPVEVYVNEDFLKDAQAIAIRGFGLAMIDVVRAIAEYHGSFEYTDGEMEYVSGKPIKGLLIPFSLDGLPPSPKPLNAAVDKLFEPSQESLDTFCDLIGDRLVQANATGPGFLIDAFAELAADIFLSLEDRMVSNSDSFTSVRAVIEAWMTDHSYRHALIGILDMPAEAAMQSYVEMATGNGSISLDYCIGQVWRHVQPSIYEQLSYNACRDEVFAEIIELDEWTKRYSYGPPVESIEQLLALHRAGVMDLSFLQDPEIKAVPDGWKMDSGEQQRTVDRMIDSVLDPPRITAVDTPLIISLLANEPLAIVHDELGLHTDEQGYLQCKEGGQMEIALLGRLAKGTVIGVDAILECFGTRAQSWAQTAADHHLYFLEKGEEAR